MKLISIVLMVVVAFYLSLSSLVLSAEEKEYRDRAIEVNELAIEKLGVSLEKISLLYYFEKEQYIGGEVIDDFLVRPNIESLISEGFLVLEEAEGFRMDSFDNSKYYYFALTSKSKILVAASR